MSRVTGDPEVRLRIAVPYVGRPPSINELSGKHWSKTHKHRDPWHKAVAQAMADYTGPRPLGPSLVRVTFPVETRTRRDGHNYAATLVKWCVDAMVADGLFVDDTPEHVLVVDSRIVYRSWLKDPEKQKRARVLVDVVPLRRLRTELASAPPEIVDLFATTLPE